MKNSRFDFIQKNTLLYLSLLLNILFFLIAIYYLRNNKTPKDSKQENPYTLSTLQETENFIFLRDFTNHWLNWNSENFYENHSRWLPTMTNSLQKEKKIEIEKLKEKILKQNVSQTAKLLLLQQEKMSNQSSLATAWLQVQIHNSDKPISLILKIIIITKNIERSSENIWGKEIQSFQMQAEANPPKLKKIPLQITRLTKLLIPCPVTSLENPDTKNIKVQVSVGSQSEIDLHANNPIQSETAIRFFCHKNYYEIIATQSPNETQLLYYVLTNEVSEKTKEPKRQQKSNFENPLWRELGFEIEPGATN